MNSKNHIFSSDELSGKIQQDTSDNKLKIAAQFLLDAINDWPTFNLSEPKEFLSILTDEIGLPLTLEKIATYSNTLHAKNSAWKMEATSSLLKVFDYDKTKTLNNIVNDITEYYKSR